MGFSKLNSPSEKERGLRFLYNVCHYFFVNALAGILQASSGANLFLTIQQNHLR